MDNLKKYFPLFFPIALIVSYFLNKNIEKENEKKTDFYASDINANVNNSLAIGYIFKINDIEYKPGKYQYVIHTTNNDGKDELKDSIAINWRDTEPPFQVIKKPKADTLYIIKDGKKYAFPKEVPKIYKSGFEELLDWIKKKI